MSLFDHPDQQQPVIKCLGCKRWFRDRAELARRPHADDCDRPGEMWV
jgi:hypothetical protein